MRRQTGSAKGLLGFRTSREHAVDIGAVIARLRHDDAVPVWLVGTSMGTVSAASVAARLGAEGPDGLVLISSVTRTHPYMRESLTRFPWSASACRRSWSTTVAIACETARYEDAADLPSRLTGGQARGARSAGGRSAGSSGLPCGPESPHAFLGIEDVLFDRVASWITRAPPR